MVERVSCLTFNAPSNNFEVYGFSAACQAVWVRLFPCKVDA